MPSAKLTIIGQLSLSPSTRVLRARIAEMTAEKNIDDRELQMAPTFLRGRVLQDTN
jgi:hypothetical protein